ncbi:MAG TPA: hypothetical protein VGR70_17030 [Stellaceae bacterium]|nr:hypothetical protein [Stellaceae bacterium]
MSLALGAGVSAHAGPYVCVVSVRQLDNPGAKSYAFTCLESDHACSSFATLGIAGKQQMITVEATCKPGNAELRFWTVPEQEDLFVNNWPSLYVATGVSGTVREQLALTAPSEKAGDVQGSLRRLVFRVPTPPLATIEVEITPKQAD